MFDLKATARMILSIPSPKVFHSISELFHFVILFTKRLFTFSKRPLTYTLFEESTSKAYTAEEEDSELKRASLKGVQSEPSH